MTVEKVKIGGACDEETRLALVKIAKELTDEKAKPKCPKCRGEMEWNGYEGIWQCLSCPWTMRPSDHSEKVKRKDEICGKCAKWCSRCHACDDHTLHFVNTVRETGVCSEFKGADE